MAKRGLYANINRRKKLGISRSKKKSTITPKAYANMKAGFPKKLPKDIEDQLNEPQEPKDGAKILKRLMKKIKKGQV